jgi:Na+-driven multidrug efflux pump
VRRYVTQTALVAAAVVAIPAVVVTLRPGLWIGAFTDAPAIHEIGADYFHTVRPTLLLHRHQHGRRVVVPGARPRRRPLVVMIARVGLVLAAALVAVNVFHARAQAVFVIIAVANVSSCLVLVALFRRILRTRETT